MEADDQIGDDEDIAECWIDSPTMEEFKTQIQDSLSKLATANTDPDAKPRLKIYKYPQFMINVAVRHILNNNVTDFISEFQMFFPEDFKLIKRISDEIHESITNALLDDEYTCVSVEIFGDDLIAVKIKL